ncbi:MAG TPA: ribosome-binding factor A [Planctomycetota bacterium]|nr:ribosome-binding factor A [Planctomycetota bacterium]
MKSDKNDRPLEDDLALNRGKDWKTLRFCRQVEEALSGAFAGGCGDEILGELGVESVMPAPDAGHLLITVVFLSKERIPDPLETLERLHKATGWLRLQVGEAISRKKVPELAFRFAPLQAG